MGARVWIRQLLCNDGTRIDFESSDIIVVVGPNNSGKSTLLREVYNISNDLHWTESSKLIKGLALGNSGSAAEFEQIIEAKSFRISRRSGITNYQGFRGNIDSRTISTMWREMN